MKGSRDTAVMEREGQCEPGKLKNAGYDLIKWLTRDNVTDIISVDVSDSTIGYLHIHSRVYLQIHISIYYQIHGRIFTDTGLRIFTDA